MHKVEIIACRALANGHNVSSGNTRVENDDTGTALYLHGHRIAYLNRNEGTIAVSDAGWQTNTTKSRLNAILASFLPGHTGISQRDWKWYLTAPDGREYAWDGGASFRLGDGTLACELRAA